MQQQPPEGGTQFQNFGNAYGTAPSIPTKKSEQPKQIEQSNLSPYISEPEPKPEPISPLKTAAAVIETLGLSERLLEAQQGIENNRISGGWDAWVPATKSNIQQKQKQTEQTEQTEQTIKSFRPKTEEVKTKITAKVFCKQNIKPSSIQLKSAPTWEGNQDGKYAYEFEIKTLEDIEVFAKDVQTTILTIRKIDNREGLFLLRGENPRLLAEALFKITEGNSTQHTIGTSVIEIDQQRFEIMHILSGAYELTDPNIIAFRQKYDAMLQESRASINTQRSDRK